MNSPADPIHLYLRPALSCPETAAAMDRNAALHTIYPRQVTICDRINLEAPHLTFLPSPTLRLCAIR